jgi:5-methylthioadenosine/S-adenosylhomocysteine deaminase
MKSIVFENGYFLPNDGSGRLLKSEMRVDGGRITKLGRVKKTKGEKRINLKGKLVIPGFVQTHVHLCQTLFRNLADDLQLLDWLKFRIWPMEGAHTQPSLYASARLGIAELLAGGTTTILDMGTVRHTDAIFEAAAEMGIRAFIGKCLMDRDENPPELREGTSAALKENLRLLNYWHGRENGRLQYAHAPRFLLSASEKLLREIKILAEERNHLVHTHSSENRAEVEAVRKLYGCENVEAFHRLELTGERLVLAHCIHLNAREERILASSGTRVSHCPSSNLKLASGLCRVPELKAKGISVSLGADGAPCNNNLNMFQEMRLASLLQKPAHGPTAMGAQEVFEMATIDGAKALGVGGEIGSLEVGKKADFVILDFNSVAVNTELDTRYPERAYSALVYSCGPGNVTETWVDGKCVFEKGSFGGTSPEKILAAALRERKKLLARV